MRTTEYVIEKVIMIVHEGIAHWDWPDAWPGLFDILMEAVRADHEFAVQGAVRVLKELVRDLTDAHIPSVAPVILPDIYR